MSVSVGFPRAVYTSEDWSQRVLWRHSSRRSGDLVFVIELGIINRDAESLEENQIKTLRNLKLSSVCFQVP